MRFPSTCAWTLALLAVAASGGSVPRAQSAGRLMFVGTYTTESGRGIYTFRFDETAGSITPLGLAIETPSPSFLTASADGRFVFAVNEVETYNGTPSGSVSSFAVDPGTGKLSWLSTQSSMGLDPRHLVLDQSGKFLVVANYTGGTVSVLPVGTDGKLRPALQQFQQQGPRAAGATSPEPGAHQVVFSQDNRFLIVPDKGLDRVFVYRFDTATGKLTPSASPSVAVTPGFGPRHIVFHPDGVHAYLADELGSMITTLTWDGATGALTAGSSIRTLPRNYVGLNTTAEIAVHPNGRFLYASNRGHDSIAIFSIGPGGALTSVGTEPTRGKTPRHFTITQNGRWLIAANQDSNTLAVFSISPVTGALTAKGALVDMPAPAHVLLQ